MSKSISLALCLAALAAAPANAAEPQISDAWFRALPANLPAGGYFKLQNTGSKALALTGAESAACGMLMLHKSEHHGGMNHMSAVDRVEVPAGGSVAFEPGGYHLMCMEPKPAMKAGAKVPVTLKFDDGSKVSPDFEVRAASAK